MLKRVESERDSVLFDLLAIFWHLFEVFDCENNFIEVKNTEVGRIYI